MYIREVTKSGSSHFMIFGKSHPGRTIVHKDRFIVSKLLSVDENILQLRHFLQSVKLQTNDRKRAAPTIKLYVNTHLRGTKDTLKYRFAERTLKYVRLCSRQHKCGYPRIRHLTLIDLPTTHRTLQAPVLLDEHVHAACFCFCSNIFR